MTQDFSFKYYIENYNDIYINDFNEYFKERIELLPDKTISSKKIIDILSICNQKEKLLFRNVFLKYFKEKIFSDM